MKKILTISLIENKYEITCNEKKIIVCKETLSMNGKEIFDAIFSDVKLDEELELEFKEENIVDSADKRIVSDIKSVFTNITNKINEKCENA